MIKFLDSQPIAKRVLSKTVKSKFVIILISLILIFNIAINTTYSFVSKGDAINSYPIWVYAFNYMFIMIFVCLFQMWYISKFHSNDFNEGVLSLEKRNGYSNKSILIQRLLTNILLSTIFIIVYDLIMFFILLTTNGTFLYGMSVNLFIGMFIAVFVNLFVYFFILCVSKNSNLIVGIVGSLLMVLTAGNWMWTMASTLATKMYANGQTISTKNTEIKVMGNLLDLENKYSKELNKLYSSFFNLEKQFVIDGDLQQLIADGFLVNSDENPSTDNYFFNYIKNWNDKFVPKIINRDVWKNTFFDRNAQKSFSSEGSLNINSLGELIKNEGSNFDKDLFELVKFNIENKFYLIDITNDYVEIGVYNEMEKFYTDNNTPWPNTYKDSTPGIRLFQASLADIIVKRFNVISSGDSEKDLTTIMDETYKSSVLNSYLNPFLGIQNVFLYNYNNKWLNNISPTKATLWWGVPIFELNNIKYKDWNVDQKFFPEIENQNNPIENSNLESVNKMKSYFFPIIIFMEYIILSIALASIYFVIYKRRMNI